MCWYCAVHRGRHGCLRIAVSECGRWGHQRMGVEEKFLNIADALPRTFLGQILDESHETRWCSDSIDGRCNGDAERRAAGCFKEDAGGGRYSSQEDAGSGWGQRGGGRRRRAVGDRRRWVLVRSRWLSDDGERWKGIECSTEQIRGGGYDHTRGHTPYTRAGPAYYCPSTGNLMAGQAVFERAIKKNKYDASLYIYHLIL